MSWIAFVCNLVALSGGAVTIGAFFKMIMLTAESKNTF